MPMTKNFTFGKKAKIGYVVVKTTQRGRDYNGVSQVTIHGPFYRLNDAAEFTYEQEDYLNRCEILSLHQPGDGWGEYYDKED